MQAEGTFEVVAFDTAEVTPRLAVATGVPVGVATMEKRFSGAIEGAVDGAAGTFAFAHSATTHGTDRTAEHFVIVPTSGTGALAGISGSGGMAVEDDGTHRIWLTYAL
jgi:Protein of unknown function (DUF3224)